MATSVRSHHGATSLTAQLPLGFFLSWSASESAVCPSALTFFLATEAHISASLDIRTG